VALYGGLTLAAFVWRASQGDANVFLHPDRRHFSWWAPLAGLVGGLAVVGLSRLAVARFEWARRLHGDFAAVLGPLDRREILILAFASSVGEEFFFRGAMLPDLGLIPSTLIFALLHVGPGWRFLPWTLSALIVGLVMGAAFSFFGDLSAPIVAHFVINYLNLRYIVERAPFAAAARVNS
jgi:membrane protease YdiL (CAAX protease family)